MDKSLDEKILKVDVLGRVHRSSEEREKSYNEELATHIGPESCEGAPGGIIPNGSRRRYREDTLEALTGETTGRAIEPRNRVILREADLLMAGGRQHQMHRLNGKGVSGSRAVEEPGHVVKLLTRKPGDLGIDLTDLASGQVRAWNPKGGRMR